MHRRVAEALEEDPGLAGDTSFSAGRVARHWYAAGDGARALVASVEAAREAKTALAFSEWAAREDSTNFVLVRSAYRQPFGTFTGSFPGGLKLAEAFGVQEVHDVHW